MGRSCKKCGKEMASYTTGKHCNACQVATLDNFEGENPYYDVYDLMKILGLTSEEYIRRLGNEGEIPGRRPGTKAHHYNKPDVDEWINSNQLRLRKPNSPIQEEAYKLCQEEDHSWFAEDRFKDHAYFVEEANDIKEHLVNVRLKRTCFFCGHSEVGWLT